MPENPQSNAEDDAREAIRARLDYEDRTYLAWCAMRGLDPTANQGEGYWTEFWEDAGGRVFPPGEE